ncbi:MAG: tRNA dihydrouridine synthase DusB [Desulfotalea sp.]
MFKVGNLQFSAPFVLAPLAGYTDLPFRLLCREYGADYVVSEMISCHGLYYDQERTKQMLASTEKERPVSFQLFGAEPEIMARASELISKYNPDMIDINMGCPVRKVTKKGAGAAMMSDPDLAEQVIKAVISNTDIPVTVKIRTGVTSDNLNGAEFAQMAESAGASLVTVHGRTRAQAFSGFADLKEIAKVKSAVSIPVIGNGDILSYDDGLKMMEETGCDGVMIGRGALGNPWVFSPEGKPNNIPKVSEVALEHLLLMGKYLSIEYAIGLIRNHISKYFKDLPGSSQIRHQVFQQPTYQSLYEMLTDLADGKFPISQQDL